MKQSSYDFVAPFYDRLSKVIFGSSLVHSQICLLPFIPTNSCVLTVGGGTGWILERLAELHTSGLTIDYVESSSKMIKLSQKRDVKGNTIRFFNRRIEDCDFAEVHDIIITPFLFDNFPEETVSLVFEKLDTMLKTDGLWLFTDFFIDDKSPLWHRMLLRMMYLFFRLTSNVNAQKLSPMEPYFSPRYTIEFEAHYYSKFIRSMAYRRVW
jgi:ubiquinone/menaquinone biosynthesis C-methylase UbiE